MGFNGWGESLPLIGGTMTGNLRWKSDYGNNIGANNNAIMFGITNKDKTNYRQFYITSDTYRENVKNALQLKDSTTGTFYNIYGEHNKPTLNDIFGTVSTSYDIETVGTYIQLQTNNDSASSLVTASGKHLYTLLSFSVQSNFCIQFAFVHETNASACWKRTWIWWTNAWSPWKSDT